MPHEPVAMADPMWGTAQAIDVTWGSLHEPDPFATEPLFDEIIPGKKSQGDAFDPFGDEDDAFTNFHPSERLFSEPEFVAVDSFSPPTTFAPPQHQQRSANNYSNVRTPNVFSHYHSQSAYPDQNMRPIEYD